LSALLSLCASFRFHAWRWCIIEHSDRSSSDCPQLSRQPARRRLNASQQLLHHHVLCWISVSPSQTQPPNLLAVKLVGLLLPFPSRWLKEDKYKRRLLGPLFLLVDMTKEVSNMWSKKFSASLNPAPFYAWYTLDLFCWSTKPTYKHKIITQEYYEKFNSRLWKKIFKSQELPKIRQWIHVGYDFHSLWFNLYTQLYTRTMFWSNWTLL